MIEVNNLTKKRIDEKLLKDIAKKVLKRENREGLDISIGIVGKEEIRKLNERYRKKNRPTDVLSFLYESSGEIVICPEIVKRNAKNFKNDFRKELKRILIHGLLHLAGHDHEGSKEKAQKMRNKENYYLTHVS